MAFGAWMVVADWRELRGPGGHARSHTHQVTPITTNDIHGPEQQTIATDLGELVLSIYEAGVPPRFRVTGIAANAVRARHYSSAPSARFFFFANHGTYWESVEEIAEPHEFDVVVALKHGGEARVFETRFAEHDHVHGGHTHDHGPDPARDPLYAPLCGDTTLLTRHAHIHQHGRGVPHTHWHDHFPETAHPVATSTKDRGAFASASAQDIGARCFAVDPGVIADGGRHSGVLRGE